MKENISLQMPMENIYKFFAIFSLLGFIFFSALLIYIGKFTNDIIFEKYIKISSLNHDLMSGLDQNLERELLQAMVDVAISNHQTYRLAITVALVFFCLLGFYGFKKWYSEVQPVLDEMSRIQLEIEKIKLNKLRLEMRNISNSSSGDIGVIGRSNIYSGEFVGSNSD